MTRRGFLSEAWFEDLAADLASLPVDPGWPPLHLGQEVTGGPHGTIRYTIHVADGRAHLEIGSLAGATATLVEDYRTAEAIARGESVSELLSAGRVKLRGDPNALLAGEEALGALGAVLSGAKAAGEA